MIDMDSDLSRSDHPIMVHQQQGARPPYAAYTIFQGHDVQSSSSSSHPPVVHSSSSYHDNLNQQQHQQQEQLQQQQQQQDYYTQQSQQQQQYQHPQQLQQSQQYQVPPLAEDAPLLVNKKFTKFNYMRWAAVQAFFIIGLVLMLGGLITWVSVGSDTTCVTVSLTQYCTSDNLGAVIGAPLLGSGLLCVILSLFYGIAQWKAWQSQASSRPVHILL
eukprot:TRINITY_DN2401_c1_g1_i1.p1 TRINITY_DN2401_c1_g1~~TRINITY_DN2401_c1_g1_i1.p1  ORF type:complete len:216 (+),score=49.35 TRINITY_DN2401_c1_g1_i1:68-715(+)